MKKKILIMLPLLGSFLLTGCKLNLFGKTIYLFEKKPVETPVDNKDEQDDPIDDPIDDIVPIDPTQHATSMSVDPNAPFYLKVGETRTVSCSLSPSPDVDSEKVNEWKLSGDNLTFVVNDATNKATLTGVKAGTSTLKVTNKYNDSLTKSFTIKVIDFDENNEYLWQYKSEDRKEFGYISSKDQPAGLASGVAVLNGVPWKYSRQHINKTTGELEDYVSSLQSSMGAVGFGKGKEPETHLHFETDNERFVEKFTLEAGSAKSLAKMTIKVGDTVYMNEKTVPADNWDVIQTITSDEVAPAKGKISIDVITPEFELDKSQDPSYQVPGAFYLKSILIGFVEENYVGIELAEDSQHKVDYLAGDEFSFEGMKINKVSQRGFKNPIDVAKAVEEGKLSVNNINLSEASHEAKEVEISLNVGEDVEPFKLNFDIHVRDPFWVAEKLEVNGEVEEQNLVEGDAVSYSSLSIKVFYEEASNDYQVVPFIESSQMSFTFDEDKDPFVAEKEMENGFNILVTGHFKMVDGEYTETVSTNYEIPANKFTVEEAIFDRIDYTRGNELEKSGIKSSSEAVSYLTGEEDRVRLDFSKVSKDKDSNYLPKTNGNILLTILDKTLSIKEIFVKFALASKNDNKYRLFSSVYGGDIYGEQLAQSENLKLEYSSFEEHVNNVLLAPQLNSAGTGTTTTNIIVLSIVIRYQESSHLDYTISYGDTVPEVLDYVEGEKFNPSGLKVVLSDTQSEVSYDITSYMKWYDGATFEDNPQETLTPESTYVIGVFHEKTIQVAINSVEAKAIRVAKVTSVDQITADGKYYFTCPQYHAILKGSSGNSVIFTGNGCYKDDELEFTDLMDFNISLEEDYLTFTPLENGKFTIQSRNGFFSINNSGNPTCSTTAGNYREFEISENLDGTLTFMIFRNDGTEEEPSGPKYYVGSNLSSDKPIIKLYGDNKANVVLYKVVD